MTQKLPALFHKRLSEIIPQSRIYSDPLRRLAYGADASFYRLTPQLVIQVDSEEEVSAVLKLCGEQKVAVTFRGAGTSLSGQAVTDSVLMVLSPKWREIKVLDNGRAVALQPGVIGAQANSVLAPYRYKIGPDPASIHAATIGGIAANNASGMCCGVKNNAYHTLQSMRVILSDGTIFDTADELSAQRFRSSHSHLLNDLLKHAAKINAADDLKKMIAHKYTIKNTTGYSLNALLDYSDPVDILQHLMIGSEGTLGFISEITLTTVPVKPFRAVGLAIFSDLAGCIEAAVQLSSLASIQALELMDDKSLLAVSRKKHVEDVLPHVAPGIAGLLIETAGETSQEVLQSTAGIKKILKEHGLQVRVEFSSDPYAMDQFWSVRKGLFPSVGAMRQAGSTVVIEDVCVPVESLGVAVPRIKNLFESHGYRDAVLFGHIRDGNLHVVFSQMFETPVEIARYQKLMEGLALLVVRELGGSLKAEHGTGRNMAPFVELEWGKLAYGMMWEIKNLFDPRGILNPGVLLNPDPTVHLKNLKKLEITGSSIDTCVECGFCEPVCPSKDLSLTPRQRIVIAREISRLEKNGAFNSELESLKQDFKYLADQTCAADGLCGTVCPVDIDTGAFIKNYRSLNQPAWKQSVARFCADHFSLTLKVVGAGLYAAHFSAKILSDGWVEKITNVTRRLTGGRFPVWRAECPLPDESMKTISGNPLTGDSSKEKLGYFPACISRGMGKSRDGHEKFSVSQAAVETLRIMDVQPVVPENINGLCCGLVFASKGFPRLGEEMRTQVFTEMRAVGTERFLCDVSPCAQWLKEGARDSRLHVLDPIELLSEAVGKSDIEISPLGSASFHAVCSVKKMHLETGLGDLAKKLVRQPVFPYAGCCGFSGDKGLFTPELSESALAGLAVNNSKELMGFTTSPTCGIAMARATRVPQKSLFHLFLDCVKKK